MADGAVITFDGNAGVFHAPRLDDLFALSAKQFSSDVFRHFCRIHVRSAGHSRVVVAPRIIHPLARKWSTPKIWMAGERQLPAVSQLHHQSCPSRILRGGAKPIGNTVAAGEKPTLAITLHTAKPTPRSNTPRTKNGAKLIASKRESIGESTVASGAEAGLLLPCLSAATASNRRRVTTMRIIPCGGLSSRFATGAMASAIESHKKRPPEGRWIRRPEGGSRRLRVRPAQRCSRI